MGSQKPPVTIPSFSIRERLVIACGVAALVFWIVSIYTGPWLVIFSYFLTLGILCFMIFQQFRELRASAKSLLENQEAFRLLVNEVQDYAIFGVAPDGKVTTWNHGAQRITGYSADEIVGRPYSLLRVPEEGRTDYSAQAFENARRDGRYQEEAWYQSKAGRRLLASTAFTPLLNPGGDLRGYSIVMCDITARKQSELQLFESYRFIERITDTLPDIVFICEFENLRKIYVNDEICKILGYSKDDLLTFNEELFNRVIHPEDKAQFTALRTMFEKTEDGRAAELQCRMRHHTGEWRMLQCRTVVFSRSADNQPLQFLAIAQDITALQRAQESARRLEHAATEKQRLALLGELSASVAHEIRNPLQGVLGCVEDLRSQVDGNARLHETVKLLEEGLQRMDRISERLLRLARSSDGEKVPYDVAQCVDGTCAFMRARAQKAGVQIVTKIDPDLPLVPMMPERISEALLNLLSNSLDACRPGGRITLTSGRSSVQDMLELRIADTGSGIPADARDRVFDMFFSTKPAGKGTGLGMSIVRRNIEAHGGTIELLETSPRGTTFRILIPLQQSAGECQVNGGDDHESTNPGS